MHNFVKRNVKVSPMHIAAEGGNSELCEHIMDRIADNNPRYLIGEMPFHWAAQKGH